MLQEWRLLDTKGVLGEGGGVSCRGKVGSGDLLCQAWLPVLIGVAHLLTKVKSPPISILQSQLKSSQREAN